MKQITISIPDVPNGTPFTPSQMYSTIMALVPYTGLDTAKWTSDEFREYWDEVNQIIQDNIDLWEDGGPDEEDTGYEDLECKCPTCELCDDYKDGKCQIGE